jgi:PAS domain S-box-containing protein
MTTVRRSVFVAAQPSAAASDADELSTLPGISALAEERVAIHAPSWPSEPLPPALLVKVAVSDDEDAFGSTPGALGSEAFLAALLRSSNDAIIGKTPQGQVTYWNAAAQRLYGYKASEILGENIAILIPADRSAELAYLLTQVSWGVMVKGFHTERLRKDGVIVPVFITVSPVIADGAKVVGAWTIAHDLTQYLELLCDAERRAGNVDHP